MATLISPRRHRGGTLLCCIGASVRSGDIGAFSAKADELLAEVERFAARSLGIYAGEADAEGKLDCLLLLAFANRPVFEQFSKSVLATVNWPWPLVTRTLESIGPGMPAPPSDVPVPFHLVNHH